MKDRTFIEDWDTVIDETWWGDATGPIPFDDVDMSNNSRVKGGKYDQHLKQLTQSIRNRIETGQSPIRVPIVIEDNPNKGKRFRLVLGHHRMRGLIENDIEACDMVHIRGPVSEDDNLRRRFQVKNNDHETPSSGNSDADIRDAIDQEFHMLLAKGQKLSTHKDSMRREVKRVIRKLVGNNKTESQTTRMVDDWVEEQERDPNSGHQTKFKFYSHAEAKEVARAVLDLDEANSILFVTNLSDGPPERYFGYAWAKKIKNPEKSITIAAYFKTANLKSAHELQEKRAKATREFNALRRANKEFYSGRRYKPLVDKIVYLPQCVDEADYPEDLDKPIMGPWE